MRDYSHFDQYINELLDDIYPQPDSPGHIDMARHVVVEWVSKLEINTVLDVGCGEAFCQELFEPLGFEYLGICLGEDYYNAKNKGKTVEQVDFNFLPYKDESFDLVWSRHSLEHSPMPLFTLFEWHRVAKNYLCLILPQPKYFSWSCPNHYGIMALGQARTLLKRAGWRPFWEDHSNEQEYRFMCGKVDRVATYTEEYTDKELEK